MTMTVQDFVKKYPYPTYGDKDKRIEWATMLLERVGMTPEEVVEFFDLAYQEGVKEGRRLEWSENAPPIGGFHGDW